MTKEELQATQPDYTQLCVWPETSLGEDSPETFKEFMIANLNARVLFIEELTLSDGEPQLFFYVHKDDLSHFSVKRIQLGIRWWEDVLGNLERRRSNVYSKETLEKYPVTWAY